MGYIKGTTSLTQEVNISKAMAGASPSMADDYVRLAGYTRGWDGTNLVVMLPQSKDGEGVFVSTLNGTTKVTGLKKNIGHANDGAYFNEQYFFATGGGKETNSKIIKCYGMDLKHDGDYTFTGPKNDISCITNIVNKYFFLGKGDVIFKCEKNNTTMTFDVIDKNPITLPVKGTVVDGWINQGMYCRSDKLYKIYGENVGQGSQIKRNYIAVFDLKGERPKYTGASLSAVYSCNREEKFLFEVQGIDVSTTGEIRIAVDKRDAGVGDYKAGVYLVKLNN